ncbi:hypothetical protein [Dactylosporangium matsuzakiense]|uniref:hypothetical protein n=1 Tax=Dactylosporangium matsuzakiense TaxID=53360 RepID=UPI0022F2FA2C|nr:hypothetical protein [Dactylosporangium matsuzakiense]
MVFTLARADGSSTSGGDVAIDVDYSGFADAYGADFGGRLRLVKLPACAISSPDAPACQVQLTVPGATNTEPAQVVSADAVSVGDAATATAFTERADSAGGSETVAVPPIRGPTKAQVWAGDGGEPTARTTRGMPLLEAATTNGQAVYALSAGASSSNGNWGATSMAPSYSWVQGRRAVSSRTAFRLRCRR